MRFNTYNTHLIPIYSIFLGIRYHTGISSHAIREKTYTHTQVFWFKFGKWTLIRGDLQISNGLTSGDQMNDDYEIGLDHDCSFIFMLLLLVCCSDSIPNLLFLHLNVYSSQQFGVMYSIFAKDSICTLYIWK